MQKLDEDSARQTLLMFENIMYALNESEKQAALTSFRSHLSQNFASPLSSVLLDYFETNYLTEEMMRK